MLRNYLIIANRNLLRHKVFSLIKIFGLAIGMAACILILQYVRYELSYEDFHKNKEHVYRIGYESYRNGNIEVRSARSFPAVATTLKNDFPEVKDVTRLIILGEIILSTNEKAIRETQVYLTDSSYFNLFSLPLIKGDASRAFAEPFSVLLSQSLASKVFGEEDPINKTINLHSPNLDGTAPFIIKGVFQDVSQNSHLKPQILISYPTLHEFIGREIDDSWRWNHTYTYVLLHPEADINAVNEKLSHRALGQNEDFLKETNSTWNFFLQPLPDIHLHSDLLHETEANGSATAVYFLLMVAVFVLIIAIINFINLSTAQSIHRAKEVGIRKTSGAHKINLIFQFFTESFIINILAIFIALTLVQLVTTHFNDLAGIPANFSLWKEPAFLPVLFGMLLLIGLASGAYPAFALSSFKPIKALKGNLQYELKDTWLRKGLVIGQFALSVMLIAGTLAAYSQFSFMLNGDLGIDIEQTLVVQAPKSLDANGANLDIFKNELQKYSEISKVAATNEIPGKEIYFRDDNISLPNQKPSATFTGIFTDQHYLELLNSELKAGRFFDNNLDSHERSVIINEKAAQVLGFNKPEDAIFQKMNIRQQSREIIGVIKDFHQQSLQYVVEPMFFNFRASGNGFNYYLIKSSGANRGLIAKVESSFNKVFPGNPYDYFFLDEYFNRQYKAEQRFAHVFNLFACLAIFIACLGLFGLISFATSQRTKEIGVRKVLGASVISIITLLNKDYLKLFLLSNMIAWPLIYWTISKWLEHYAHRIDINLWLFLFPSLLIFLIAILTVCLQTWKAANADPVKSLKYE